LLIFFKYTKYIKKTDRIKTRISAIKAPNIRAKGIKLAIIVKKNRLEKLNFFENTDIGKSYGKRIEMPFFEMILSEFFP
jgi:DNA-directed RNA polymerase subunit E'/Rpb7